MSFVHAGGYQKFRTSGLPATGSGDGGYGKGEISWCGRWMMIAGLGGVSWSGRWVWSGNLARIQRSYANVLRVRIGRVDRRVVRPRQWSIGRGSLEGVERRRRVWLVLINELRVRGIGALDFCSGISVLTLRIHSQERPRGIDLAGNIPCCG